MKTWLVEVFVSGELAAAHHRKAPDMDCARRDARSWLLRNTPSAFDGLLGPLLPGFELRVTEVTR